ncbi:MAG: type II toxin-antitoxin system RelE/ParE family toxin [Gallionella sp.]
MPRLIWSPSALLDIQRAYRFLLEKNPAAAQQAAIAIRESVNILAQHPEIGRPIQEMEPEYREWPIAFGSSGYVALYHYDRQTAIIVSVRHQREAGY